MGDEVPKKSKKVRKGGYTPGERLASGVHSEPDARSINAGVWASERRSIVSRNGGRDNDIKSVMSNERDLVLVKRLLNLIREKLNPVES